MKATKAVIILILLIYILPSYTYPLDWAEKFVVWKGNVYIVDEKVHLLENQIGKRIGKVKRLASDRTGKYYGDASNLYPKETPYYEIIEIPTSVAISVKHKDTYFMALYSHKAPFHIMNILTNKYFLLSIICISIIFIRRYRSKNESKRLE